MEERPRLGFVSSSYVSLFPPLNITPLFHSKTYSFSFVSDYAGISVRRGYGFIYGSVSLFWVLLPPTSSLKSLFISSTHVFSLIFYHCLLLLMFVDKYFISIPGSHDPISIYCILPIYRNSSRCSQLIPFLYCWIRPRAQILKSFGIWYIRGYTISSKPGRQNGGREMWNT